MQLVPLDLEFLVTFKVNLEFTLPMIGKPPFFFHCFIADCMEMESMSAWGQSTEKIGRDIL